MRFRVNQISNIGENLKAFLNCRKKIKASIENSKIIIAQKYYYRTRTIISQGLYTFNPFFSVVYNQGPLTLQTILYTVGAHLRAARY